MPIDRRGFPVVIMNRHVDVILVAKFFDGIQRFRGRFRHERFDPNLSPELEHIPAARRITRNLVEVIRQEPNAGGVQFQPDLLQLVVG